MDKYFVKVRLKGEKRFYFLTPDGCLNGLRFYAGRFTKEKAENIVFEIRKDELEAKVVLIK